MSRNSETKPVAAAKPTAAQRRARTAREAIRHLSRADRRLGALIKAIGPFRPEVDADPFHTLVGSIIQQQISMSAAASVQRKLGTLCPRKRIRPEDILNLSDDELRSAGLSRQKSRYLRSLAEHFASGELSSRKLRKMSDEEVIEATTRVVGIGRWTAEMLLIFCLERPDVWPVDDLGLRKAAQAFFQMPEMPPPKALLPLGEALRPYRTYASWYLWRSLEGPFMPGVVLA
jgi:DNA-3-methyladenine glycosylase II